MLLGLAMMGGAGYLVVFNGREEAVAGESAAQIMDEVKTALQNMDAVPESVIPLSIEESAAPASYPQPTPVPEMPVLIIEGRAYIGYLEIPTIDISIPVLSNWSYPQLRVSPCRYAGNVYEDTLVILAHNYKRHFGKIKLLEVGDPVQFVDAKGNIFHYIVAKQEVLQATEVERLLKNDWDLTLLTCTYGGKERVAVRLERVLAY